MTHNTYELLKERNKALLAKIEELENKEKVEMSREALIDKLNNWKKENIEAGDRLKEYEGNTYPSFMKNSDWPIWKHLASNANFELNFTTYTSKEELTVDFIIEKMLNSILRQSVSIRSLEGLKEKHWEEIKELKTEIDTFKQEIAKVQRQKRAFETVSLDYLKELVDKKLENGKLEEQNKELNEANKVLEKELELEKESALTHLDGIKVCEDWYFTHHIIPLNKEVADNLETLRAERETLSGEREKNRELQKKLEDSLEMLEEVRGNLRGERKKNQELMGLLKLFTKPLPKRMNGLKTLKEKTKTKFQQLIEKTKHQSQELIARIEVKVR